MTTTRVYDIATGDELMGVEKVVVFVDGQRKEVECKVGEFEVGDRVVYFEHGRVFDRDVGSEGLLVSVARVPGNAPAEAGVFVGDRVGFVETPGVTEARAFFAARGADKVSVFVLPKASTPFCLIPQEERSSLAHPVLARLWDAMVAKHRLEVRGRWDENDVWVVSIKSRSSRLLSRNQMRKDIEEVDGASLVTKIWDSGALPLALRNYDGLRGMLEKKKYKQTMVMHVFSESGHGLQLEF